MSTPKKIAVLCNYRLMPERIGGMDRFFWQFDAEIKKMGHEIWWFFPNQNPHNHYQNFTIIAEEKKSVEVIFLNYSLQNKVHFDFVFTHFIELCTPFFKRIKQQYATKIIAVDHNPRPLDGYPLIKKIKKRIKGSLFSRYIDVFIGVSEYTKKQLINDFGKQIDAKIKVIYNGIEQGLYQKRIQRNQSNPQFLVASHLRFSKGIQDLILAVSLLPLEIKNQIKIDVYGDGDYKESLENQVKKYQVESCFQFKGSVPNLYEIYAQYDYMIQPTHMECFSLSILESLSANVPVITTPVGGNEEVISNGFNGYILPVQNPKVWSVMFEKLYTGEKKITSDTFELINNSFSIEKMVANYVKLL